MKKLLLLSAFACITALVQGQTQIKLEEAKTRVGDSVSVCGKVFSARYLESATNAPTLVNLGGAYPNELLTLVIFGENRGKFKDKPEEAWKDKTVCITGRITDYRGKPQIIITRAEQVTVQ